MKGGIAMDYGDKIKSLRIKNNMTQAELAKLLSKSEAAISMWELGKREIDFATLRDLSRIFHVSIDYLLGREEISRTTPFQFAMYENEGSLTEDQKELLTNLAKELANKNKINK